jgi:hypothetical protein
VGQHAAAIGFSQDGSGPTRFRGMLDEVMIWSRVLSAKEVGELYTLQK